MGGRAALLLPAGGSIVPGLLQPSGLPPCRFAPKLRRGGYSSDSPAQVSSSSFFSAGSVLDAGPFPTRYGLGVFEISGRESGGSGFDPTWLLRRARDFRHCFRSHIVRRTLLSEQIIRTA